MNWLFVAHGFPNQFVYVARVLAEAGHRVVTIARARPGRAAARRWNGVELVSYRPRARRQRFVLERLTDAVEAAEAVAAVARRLDAGGFTPDLTVGHASWGEIMYLKDVWPQRPLLGYFEFFVGYRPHADFDPEFPTSPEERLELRTASAADLVSLDAVDRGVSPTRFQRDTYPRPYRRRIDVIHEGVDTDLVRPNPEARVWLNEDVSLSPDDEVLTYCSRSLEPHRGFHVFMRALPDILRRRPRARVVIAGAERASYGDDPETGSYREQLLAEVGAELDMSRVHFFGQLPYHQFIALLQVSSAHVYLTYPFSLSWSLIEAMACGCLVVGSRTGPVEEVIEHGRNGLLAGFFDRRELVDRVCDALEHQSLMRPLRAAARETACRRYDLRTVCLPAHLRLYRRLTR
jgi:glycosyltransferase involved in cell wall biosynthesis